MFASSIIRRAAAAKKKAEEEERKRQAAAAKKKAEEEERKRQAAAAAAARWRAGIAAAKAAAAAAAKKKAEEAAAKKKAEKEARERRAAKERAAKEAARKQQAAARLAAKNEAIAYSQNQTNALKTTIMATIAMEAEATKKAQEASDLATKLKFEQIAEKSKQLAIKRNAERRELLEQIEKNKLEANRLREETDIRFIGEIGKIKKWQDEHTKMPLNFIVNFLPSNV